MKFENSLPKINLSDLEAFEKTIKSLVPQSYREFLLEVNGGFGQYSKFNDFKGEDISSIDYFFGLQREGEPLVNESGSLSMNVQWSWPQSIYSLPESTLFIGRSPIASTFLSVGKKDYGYIYNGNIEDGDFYEYSEKRAKKASCEQEMANLGFPLIARSFEELLLNVIEENDEDEDD